jgi:hypothetical protein
MKNNLPSTANTPAIYKRIMTAARKYFHKRNGIEAFFEHGHWWMRIQDDTEETNGFRTYDAVDAEGGNSVNGFDFEEV